MRTILGLNLVFLLAMSAFAQDRNFPAALGAGLPPLHSFGPNFGPQRGLTAADSRRTPATDMALAATDTPRRIWKLRQS